MTSTDARPASATWWFYAAFLALFLASRLAFLDADVPRYDVTGYSPVDEFYYNQLAFEVSERTPTLLGFDIDQDLEARNLAQAYLTSLTLAVFGDNYYGLRIPSVLAGLLVFFFWLRLCLRRFGFAGATLFGLLLLTDFGFILSNRVAEPTIIRLAATTLVLWYLLATGATQEPRRMMTLGFLSAAAWLFVYPTNIFLMPAGLLTCLVLSHPGARMRSALGYLAGALLGGLLFAAVLLLTFSWSSLTDGWEHALTLYGNRVASGQTIAGVTIPFFVYNVYVYRAASYFRLSLYFQAFTLVVIALAGVVIAQAVRSSGWRGVVALWSRSRIEDKVVLIYFASFFALTVVINDFPYRKLSLAFPFILYILLLCIDAIRSLSARSAQNLRRLALVGLLPVIAMAAARSLDLIYLRPTYEYRTAMRSLDFLEGEYVIGGLSTVFRGYNGYRTYLKPYMYTDSPARKPMYEGHLMAAAKLTRPVYVVDYSTASSDARYLELGYSKLATVMGINDPTNVNAEVGLFGNLAAERDRQR